MNKRDFLFSGAGAALATAALAAPEAAQAAAQGARATPATDAAPGAAWLGRTQRHPDLAAPSADRFEAYVGQAFACGDTPLLLTAVTRQPTSCARTAQFSVHFRAAAGALPATGLHVLQHASGQRLALHLEAGAASADAHFSLMA